MGKRFDLVLRFPAFFGAKPEMVLLGGVIVVAQMSDPNASIPTPQPVYTRPFGSFGRSVERNAVIFVRKAAQGDDVALKSGIAKSTPVIENTRGIGKRDMRLNSATPTSRSTPKPTRCGRMVRY